MKSDRTFKEKVHEHCLLLLANRMEALQIKLRDLQESAANETKSSAGDKFETARAMLHIEQDQVRKQILELKAQQAVLNNIEASLVTKQITLGSLVLISEGYYYLSTSLGKIFVEGKTVFALSMQSPLGAKLKGLSTGDELMMNEKKMIVSEVL